MLGEAFREEFALFDRSDEICPDLLERLDIGGLFHRFIDGKYEILQAEKAKAETTKPIEMECTESYKR